MVRRSQKYQSAGSVNDAQMIFNRLSCAQLSTPPLPPPRPPIYKSKPKSNMHLCIWCEIYEHYIMHRLYLIRFFPPICVPHCCLSVLSLALQCISLATKNGHIFSCSVSPLPSVCLADRKPSKKAANKGYRLHSIYVKYSNIPKPSTW